MRSLELVWNWASFRFAGMVSLPVFSVFREQYKELMRLWHQLAAAETAKAWVPQKAKVRLSNDSSFWVPIKWVADKTTKPGQATMLTRHAVPLRLAGHSVIVDELQEHFDWGWWWRECHTNDKFVQASVREVFWLFHAVGTIQNSEAYSESLASVLKHMGHGSKLGTRQLVDRVFLRLAGINGQDAQGERSFILRCWHEIFGDKSQISFFAKDAAQRAARYPLGSGSLTLHRLRSKERVLAFGAHRRLKRLPRLVLARAAGLPLSFTPNVATWRKALSKILAMLPDFVA